MVLPTIELPPPEWWNWTLSNTLSASQLVFTAVGFGLAVVQLWRTADATVASNRLLARRLLSNDLLVLLPELHQMEDQLDQAIKGGVKEPIERALNVYSRTASKIRGHLEANESTKDEALVRLLKGAADSARTAKGELSGPSIRTVDEILALPRKKLSKVSDEAAKLIATLQKDVA